MELDDLYDMADKLPMYKAPDPWETDSDILRHLKWKYRILPMRKKVLKFRRRRFARKSRRGLWQT